MNSRKRRIAIIIPGGIGTGHNNIGVPVLEQIIRLLVKDFSITVFQLYKTNADYTPEGFELIEVYSRNPIRKYFKLFAAFRKTHSEKRFEVVHGFWGLPNGVFAVLFGKLFRIKSVVSILGGDAIALPEINYGQLQKSSYKKLIFWALRHADEANALTRYLIDNLKKAGFERRDFKTIPWGIDTSLFSFREKEIQRPVKFLHIANLNPVKDQETLLRAFAEINSSVPSELLIIGVGTSESEIRQLIPQLHLESSVTIIGLLPYHELHKYYHGADILLHTSRSEGQSEVVTEAMSSGVVVCGTKVGLLYDLPDCCVSVEVRDYKSLSEETLKLINDPVRFKKIKQRAHTWTKEHSILWTVDRIKECYR